MAIQTDTNTILVVDDNPQNVDLLLYSLKLNNFNVLTAYDTTEARDLLLTNLVDVLLLDINMPGQNGFSFCKELREIEKFELLPIIFVSSVDRDIGFKEAIVNGGDDFINKPIRLNELIAKVNAFIRIKKLQDQLIHYRSMKEEEIKMARIVQSHLIADKDFVWHECRIRALFKPFNQIGGDFFEFWEEKENLHFILADCSGRGVSASLLSAMLKMQVLSLPHDISLAEKTKVLRQKLIFVLPKDFYITFFICTIYPDLKMEYINGGHPAGLYLDNNEISFLQSNSMLIINSESQLNDVPNVLQLHKGSKLLFYTDGASEVGDPNYKLLGTDGLADFFKDSAQANVNIIENVLDKIFKFSTKNQLEDDITLISLEI